MGKANKINLSPDAVTSPFELNNNGTTSLN